MRDYCIFNIQLDLLQYYCKISIEKTIMHLDLVLPDFDCAEVLSVRLVKDQYNTMGSLVVAADDDFKDLFSIDMPNQ